VCGRARAHLGPARRRGAAGEAEALDAHLSGCAGCRRYGDRAAHVTRLTRTRAVESVPDLVATVVAAAPPPRRWIGVGPLGVGALRLGIGAVGIGQCVLAISGIVDAGAAQGAVELAGASAAHMSHESAAWNLALAVGFLWVAAGTSRRVSGLVALVGAFVGMLTVLSVLDLVDGRVDPVRLATHLLVVVGFVLLLVLHRSERGGSGGRLALHPPELHPAQAGEPGPPTAGTGLAPTAHQRVA